MNNKCFLLTTCLTFFLAASFSIAETLPSAKSLFAKHVEVSYGKNGLKDNPTLTITTETLMKEYGITVPAVAKQKSPGLRYSMGEAMGIRSGGGCNLSFCWEQGRRGFEVIKGKELARWLEQSDYHRWENMDRYSKTMETLALVQQNNEAVYKVKVIDRFDQENFYYFSKDRGFLVATELMIADLNSFQPRSTTYSDFKPFGPFTLAATAIEIQPQVTRITTIVDVSYDDIPDSAFEIPEEIRKLVAQE